MHTSDRYLRVIIPIMLLLILWQLGTAIFADSLGDRLFGRLHPRTGYLLVALVLVHITLNRGWLRQQYFPKKKTPADVPPPGKP